MIQRIQSVYLFLTTITSILFLSGTIILFSDGTGINISGISGNVSKTSSSIFPVVTVLLAAIPLLSFVTIFLYRNRRLQLRLINIDILLIVLLAGVLGWICYDIIEGTSTQLVFTYKLVLPFLMLVFCVLANAGVRKDERIVRSYDRLR